MNTTMENITRLLTVRVTQQLPEGTTWRLDFAHEEAPKKMVTPLMGWHGEEGGQHNMPNRKGAMRFDSKESAIAYAEKMGYEVEVLEPKTKKKIPKSYSANFKYFPEEW